MTGFTIRDARWPDDEATAISFIDALQNHEYAFEKDRRIDPAVGKEYFTALRKRIAEQQGRVFVAAQNRSVVGWAVFLVEHNFVYVVEEQRTFGYIAELFVVEEARGRGIGQSLIAACEEEGRARGLKLMMIGVIPGNKRTAAIYTEAGYAPYSMELRKFL